MLTNSIARAALLAAIVACGMTWSHGIVGGQQALAVQRTVLLQQDLTIPGYQVNLVSVAIPAGGREGRHTHPGTAVVHVESGVLTLAYEGKPTMTYKAGDSFSVEPGKIHEGINNGNAPVKAIATFIVEKGKPLTTQAK